MKHVRLLVVCAAAFALPLLLNSCKSKAPKDPSFNPYITGFSNQNVSIISPIRVMLSNEITEYKANDLIDKKLFKFSPKVDGDAFLVDPRTVEFRPKEPLKPGATYDVQFELGALVANVPAELNVFSFQVATIQPRLSYFVDGLKMISNQDDGVYLLAGNISTSDYVSDAQAEATLQVKDSKGNKLDVVWEHEQNRKHIFTVNNIKSEASAYQITVSVDGKGMGHNYQSQLDIKVPGFNDFELLSTRLVIDGDQQHIVCSFSAPIDRKQSLDGLITLTGCRSLRYKVDLNTVYVYPQSKMAGTQTLAVHEGIRNTKGGVLVSTYEETLTFEVLKPKVRFMSKGGIMPSSEGLHVRFQAVSLKSVNVRVIKLYESNILQFLQVNLLNGNNELARAGRLVATQTIALDNAGTDGLMQWGTYAIDMSKFIEPDPGAIYRVELNFTKQQAIYPCSDSKNDDDEYYYSGDSDATYDELIAGYDNGSNGYSYYYSEDDDSESSYYSNPCRASYYSYNRRRVSRNILASDIGIVAKRGDGNSMWVTTTDLVSAQAKGNVTVEAYNYQQQLLGSAITDADGMAQLALKGVPYALIAKSDKQRAYLRVDERNALNLSSFDISGDVVQKGLKGFIYGERGVWRPGDTLYISFILEDRNKVLPDNHPVNFELINPSGQVVQRQTQGGNKHHFYSFIVKTDEDAPTGTWEVVAKIGGSTFRKGLKIETVKPNRLKVEFALSNGNVLTDKSIDGTLTSRWLHGAIAKNLDAKISLSAASAKTTFKGYEAYSFDSPMRSFDAQEKEIFSGKLDENGTANIRSTYNPGSNSPGTIKLRFTSRVFEEGGDFSVNESSATMLPYKVYIGVKEPKGAGDDNMLETDKEQTYDIVTLDANGNPVDVSDLKVEVRKVSWSWWWSVQNNGTANYSQSRYDKLAKTMKVATTGGKGTFTFTAKHNEWGRYVITVTDGRSAQQTGLLSYIDWPSWGGRPRQGEAAGATMLTITSDKKKYKVGETATLSIPSSQGARALVSVENGSKVVRSFWVDATGEQTSVSFDLTQDMLPNVYAHVTLMQPHAQTKNDLPIRLYGVVPILVEDANTILKPKVEMPDVLQPLQPFTIKVSEENKREMTYTIAIVDEGLLDLTNFKTPDPWRTFFAREALGVRTWDMFDMVLGAYGGRIEQLFAIGGDDEASEKKRATANRFKPVVKFLGPFTLSGRSNEHTVTLPNYVGSVRTMVVAGNGQAYGNVEKATPVRKPLMVLATLPRVLGPGEEVLLPVNVFVMENSLKKVSVEVKASDIFELGDQQKSVSFAAPGDEVVNFRLKVKERIGIGTVKVVVTGGNEKAEYDIEIDVRNANPKTYAVTSAMVEAGKAWNSTYTLPGMEGTNSSALEVSTFPPVNLEQRLGYLLGYPHGCLEQTTSKIFPQLYLSKMVELSKDEKTQTENNIKAGLERLKLFITPEGGFAYWPGDRFPNLWASSYAGHFIVEAEKMGYSLPFGMKRNWVKFQKKEANSWSKASDKQSYYTYAQNDFDQAYRLYTLALANEAELGAMNRLKERSDLSIQARWCLAAAYAVAGQVEVAKKIVATASVTTQPYRNGFSQSFGSEDRDKAMILEALTLLNMREEAFPLVQQISESLSAKSWMSTQTTAYCLMAMSKFASSEKGSNTISMTYTDGAKQNVKSTLPVWKAKLSNIKQDGSVELQNTGDGTLFVRVVAQGIPAAGQEVASEKSLRLTVKYTTTSGSALNVQSLQQGTDFAAVVTVHNPGTQGDYKNMILNQIFPSGWEILNTRMLEGFSISESSYDYRDIRDDRVYTYFPLRAGQSATYVVRLTAAYRGRFYMSAVACEAMYDAGIAANNTGMWVEVK